MNKLKTVGRILLEIVLFTLPFLWAPFWVQCIITTVLSLATELYLARKHKSELSNTIGNIDFSKFKKNLHSKNI